MKKFGTAIILAGGKSSRMGFDKQQLRINDIRIMNILLEKLESVFDEIIVVTQTPGLYSDFDCIAVSDEIKGKGPLGGIHRGLMESKSEYAYVVACDMPNINVNYIHYMMNLISTDIDACVTKYGVWIEPFNSFYAKHTVPTIEEYLHEGGRSIFTFLRSLDCCYIEEIVARKYSKNWDMFLNLNTKEDLMKYGKLKEINN